MCILKGARRSCEIIVAFQLLEGLSDLGVGLDVCERALDHRPGLSACHFLADYLTLHFQRQVSPARRQHIHALHLGSKVCEGDGGTVLVLIKMCSSTFFSSYIFLMC